MTLNTALSFWSIFIQIMIQVALFLMFVVSWLSTRKKIFFTWTIAWGLNILALSQVLVVSYVSLNIFYQTFFYSFYGVIKILFGFFLLFSAIQFVKKDNPLNIPFLWVFLVFVFLWFFFLFLKPVVIQFIVYGIVAFFLFAGAILSFRDCSFVECKVMSVGFIIHGIMFLHHFMVLFPWFVGGRVPAYMSRISFVDAISEFILALSFFLAVIIRVVRELRESNRKLEMEQENLRNIVDIDHLTGLKNRRVLRDFFEEIKGRRGCVIFIDVNKFKEINDNWGHEVGDRCLREIALKLKDVFRKDDGLFRIGGDEFLVVCPDLHEEGVKERIEEIKRKILNVIKGLKLTIAVGIENFEENSHIDEVMKRADKKMYGDKRG